MTRCQEEVKRKMRKNREKNNYVDNKKFYTHMLKYRQEYDKAIEKGTEKPKLSNFAGKCIFDIAHNLSMSGKFRNYTFRDEMVEDGIENAIAYAHNFNPEKYTNPFAYFTQIIYYAFIRRLNKEEKNLYVKYKSIQKFNMESSLKTNGSLLIEKAIDDEDYSEMIVPSESTLEKMNEFIKKYEEKRGLKDKKEI